MTKQYKIRILKKRQESDRGYYEEAGYYTCNTLKEAFRHEVLQGCKFEGIDDAKALAFELWKSAKELDYNKDFHFYSGALHHEDGKYKIIVYTMPYYYWPDTVLDLLHKYALGENIQEYFDK